MERRDAKGDVDGNRALERDRLQRDGTPGTSEQNVSAHADTKADVTAGAYIIAGKRAPAALPAVGANTAQLSTPPALTPTLSPTMLSAPS